MSALVLLASQMAEEKRQEKTAKELQESAQKVGRPQLASEDLTREVQLKTEERFREREARRQSIEVAEQQAAEEAEAAAAALVARYCLNKAEPSGDRRSGAEGAAAGITVHAGAPAPATPTAGDAAHPGEVE